MIIKINWLTSCFPDTLVRKKRSAEPEYFAYYAAYNAESEAQFLRSLSFDDIDFNLSDVEVKTSWYVVEYHMMTV